MTLVMINPVRGRRGAGLYKAMVTTVIAFAVASNTMQAQAAIGVPFVGRNHLSFSVTELSRDGIGTERTAVFGGVYGRRFGSDDAPVQLSMLVRGAARPTNGIEDGVVDGSVVVAGTHKMGSQDQLSITGAVGVGAVAWGQEANADAPDRGRMVARAPVSAGVAYDLRLGRAVIAPFVALTGAYTSERTYIDDERTSLTDGWRLGHTAGISVRFKEAVLSLSEINRERGMPNKNRILFSAGMSW